MGTLITATAGVRNGICEALEFEYQEMSEMGAVDKRAKIDRLADGLATVFGLDCANEPSVSGTCQMSEMNEPDVKTVMGYEFDDSRKFSDDTLYVLALLRRRGAVSFYIDDSVEHAEVVEQLQAAAEDGYFTVFCRGHHIVVIEADRFKCNDL